MLLAAPKCKFRNAIPVYLVYSLNSIRNLPELQEASVADGTVKDNINFVSDN